jgi:hypothetical protein
MPFPKALTKPAGVTTPKSLQIGVGVIAAAVLHLAVVGPAFFYWRRMTWT